MQCYTQFAIGMWTGLMVFGFLQNTIY